MNENEDNNEEPKDPSNQEFDSFDKGKESQGFSNLEYDQADEAEESLKRSLPWFSIGLLVGYFISQGIFIIPFIGELQEGEKPSTEILFKAMALNAMVWIAACLWLQQRIPLLTRKDRESEPNYKYVFIGIAMIFGTLILFATYNELLNRFLEYEPDLQSVAKLVKEMPNDQLYLVFLTPAILIPIVEELLFRGFMYNSFKNVMKLPYAAIISAAIFAVVHGEVQAMPQLFVLALVFTYCYEKSNTILVPIALHMFNNGMSVIALLFATS